MTENIKSYPNLIDGNWMILSETLVLALNAPFGGFKQSSANIFKEQRQTPMDFYTRTKTIYINHG